MARRERIGLVLGGGGARGAYEAGVLSVLGPELERLGQRPSVFVGSSVGALNATFLAANRHRKASDAVEDGIATWREISLERIVRPVTRQLPRGVLQYLGEVLAVPGMQLSSLLDPEPLSRALPEWVNLDDVHRNIAEHVTDALAIAATPARSGRAVVFVESDTARVKHRSHLIDYVPARIEVDQLRASAAIPLLFPPVWVGSPHHARGWYVDGGTRLNTPIKPALDLGVDRLVVIGTESVRTPDDTLRCDDESEPDIFNGVIHLLAGALGDPLAEDIVRLGNVNLFFADSDTAPAANRYRRIRGKAPYQQVPYIFIAPRHRGAISELGRDVFRSRYGGWRWLRSPTTRLLGQLLGGDTPARAELLSYLYFDPEFHQELITMGQEDARRWFAERPDPDDPWQVEPLAELTNPSASPGHESGEGTG